jgi:hypothetical protein
MGPHALPGSFTSLARRSVEGVLLRRGLGRIRLMRVRWLRTRWWEKRGSGGETKSGAV